MAWCVFAELWSESGPLDMQHKGVGCESMPYHLSTAALREVTNWIFSMFPKF